MHIADFARIKRYCIYLRIVSTCSNVFPTVLEPLEFQTVVVVPKSFTPTEGGFSSLIGSGLCHPGFSQSQRWNDRILKYFERGVMNNVCRAEMTVAENEIANLKDFFKKGCRPGPWVSDKAFNEELSKDIIGFPYGLDSFFFSQIFLCDSSLFFLEKKYPELCELCDDKVTCTYANRDRHGHIGALECLTSGRGQVAYAALHYVQDYFAVGISIIHYTILIFFFKFI